MLSLPPVIFPVLPSQIYSLFNFIFLKILFIFTERGREGGREEEGERNISLLPLVRPQPPARDLARNPGMCPDQEFNQRPFSSQASTENTELHQPGLFFFF